METVCNPTGRFKTLEGIYIETDGTGQPVFSFSGVSACFNVQWKRRKFVLKAFLRSQQDTRLRLKKVAAYLPLLTSPYLVEYIYLPKEMLVFNDFGDSYYVDVVLMECPAGRSLQETLEDLCDREDAASLKKLLKEFCNMGSWLICHDIVHNQLNPHNIVIGADCKIKLINYEHMEVPIDNQLEDKLDNDNIVVANMALGLKVLTADPSTFRALDGNSVFRLPVLKSSLLPMFADAAYHADCAPMQAIVEMLLSCNYVLHRRTELSRLLGELAEDDTSLKIDLSRIDPTKEVHEEDDGDDTAEHPIEAVCLKHDLSEYTYVGTTSESMISVEKDGAWGYLHSDGTVAIPLKYAWADDFAEGRGVVFKDECYGMIDKSGKEIVPIIYESLAWDCYHGIAVVSYNGIFGVLDRDGKELIPLIYDWMGDPTAPLIAVKKDGKGGYIYPNGEVAIDFRFDEVYGFIDGLAIVRETKDGEEYTIDEQGRRVDEPARVAESVRE